MAEQGVEACLYLCSSMADSPATDEDTVLSRGHPGHLTPEETATLEALRAQVNPEHIAQVSLARSSVESNQRRVFSGAVTAWLGVSDQVRGGERRRSPLPVPAGPEIRPERCGDDDPRVGRSPTAGAQAGRGGA